jgi:hypothetical protein
VPNILFKIYGATAADLTQRLKTGQEAPYPMYHLKFSARQRRGTLLLVSATARRSYAA